MSNQNPCSPFCPTVDTYLEHSSHIECCRKREPGDDNQRQCASCGLCSTSARPSVNGWRFVVQQQYEYHLYCHHISGNDLNSSATTAVAAADDEPAEYQRKVPQIPGEPAGPVQ